MDGSWMDEWMNVKLIIKYKKDEYHNEFNPHN